MNKQEKFLLWQQVIAELTLIECEQAGWHACKIWAKEWISYIENENETLSQPPRKPPF